MNKILIIIFGILISSCASVKQQPNIKIDWTTHNLDTRINKYTRSFCLKDKSAISVRVDVNVVDIDTLIDLAKDVEQKIRGDNVFCTTSGPDGPEVTIYNKGKKENLSLGNCTKNRDFIEKFIEIIEAFESVRQLKASGCRHY